MNRGEARDVIYAHGTLAWTDALASIGKGGVIRYGGLLFDPETGAPISEPPADAYWMRLSRQTVSEDQETLRNGEVRRFLTIGNVFAQIFVPLTSPKGGVELDALSEFVRNRFRDRQADDNLEFTRARIDDNVRHDATWLTVNVTARFSYRQFI